MKKLSKIFLVLFIFTPIIISAKTSEEVKYKFYTEVEDNLHYEKDVENSCEYFELIDKNSFIYSDLISTTLKPEEKEGRIIEEELKEIRLNRDYITKLEINYFYTYRINKKIYEIEFYDSNDTKLEYEIENATFVSGWSENLNDDNLDSYVIVNTESKMKIAFDDVVNIKNLKIKVTYEDDSNTFYGIVYIGYVNDLYSDAYDYTSVNSVTNCEDSKCNMFMDLKDKTPTDRDLIVKTIVYNYKDPMYKCYSLKRVYVPGYYTELEGFIKDEEKYVIERVEDDIEEKDALSDKLSLLNESNERILNEFNTIKSDSLLNNIDDVVNVLNNQKDDEIMNKLNSLTKNINNNGVNYLNTLNALKTSNDLNTEKLNNLEKLFNINDFSKTKDAKNDDIIFKTIYLIILLLEIIIIISIILIPNKIVKKSRMKL